MADNGTTEGAYLESEIILFPHWETILFAKASSLSNRELQEGGWWVFRFRDQNHIPPNFITKKQLDLSLVWYVGFSKWGVVGGGRRYLEQAAYGGSRAHNFSKIMIQLLSTRWRIRQECYVDMALGKGSWLNANMTRFDSAGKHRQLE